MLTSVLSLRAHATVEAKHRVSGDALLVAESAMGLAVDLGDVDLVLHLAGELPPGRGELLAVSAPVIIHNK